MKRKKRAPVKPGVKAKLRKTSGNLSVMFETVPEGITMIDLKGRIFFANSAAERILGLSKKTITSRLYNDPKWKIVSFDGGPVPGNQLPFVRVLKTKKPVYNIKHAIRYPSGRTVYLSINAAPIKNEKGKMTGVIAAVSDITEQKESGDRIIKEKEIARKYIEIAGTIIVVLNSKGKITLINRRGCRALGYKDENELTGKDWFENFVPKEQRRGVKAVFAGLMAGKTMPAEYFENRIIDKKGEVRLIAWHNALLKDEKGRITGTISSGEDVTDQKFFEETIKESEEKYRMMFDASNDAVFVYRLVDGKKPGNFIAVNSNASKKLGYSVKEFMKMTPNDLAVEESRKILPKIYEQIRRKGRIIAETVQVAKNGSLIPVEISVSLVNFKGKPTVLSVARDISDRVEARKKLEEQNKINSLRADIWKLASDETLGESELIQKMLDKMGPVLGASRITFSAVQGDKMFAKNEWKAPGVIGSVKGIKVPAELFRDLNLKKQEIVTEKALLKRGGRRLKGVMKRVVSMLVKLAGNHSGLLTPYFIAGKAEGALICNDAENPVENWSREKRDIVSEAALIISRTIEGNRTRKTLEENEKKYRELFDNANDAVILSGLDAKGRAGKIIEANSAAMKLLGRSPDEIKKLTPRDIVDAESITDFPRIGRELKEKGSCVYDTRVISMKGAAREAEISSHVFMQKGRPVVLSVLRDVTERKAAEQAVKESESRFRSLFENMTTAFALHRVITDKKGNPVDYEYVEANQAFEKFTGLKRDRLIGKSVTKLIPGIEKDKAGWIKNFGRVAVTGKPWRAEQGSEALGRWYSVLAYSPMKNYFVALFDEITDKKRAEIAIRESEEKFRKLAETMEAGLVIINKKMKIVYVNRYACRVLERKEKNILNRGFPGLVHGDFEDVMKERFRRRIGKEDISKGIEFKIVTASGKERWIEYNGAAIEYRGEGAILGTFVDIDDKKRAEREIVESEEKFRTLSEQSLLGITIVQDNRIVYVNKGMEKLGGHKVEEMIKWTADDYLKFIHPDSKNEVIKYGKKRMLGDKSPQNYQMKIKEKTGEAKWVSVFSNLINYMGRPAEFVTIADVSEIKLTQEMLSETVEELRRSNEDLENFAYVASHDLQEPLRMVSSYVQLLERRYAGKFDEDADEFIGYAVEGAERMRTLIKDLLAYSRIGTRGKEFKKVDMNSAVEQAVANLGQVISDTGAEITRGKLPAVLADDVQMVQLFQNLIGNAVKFTPEGVKPDIKITAKKMNKEAVFEVADNGIGMKKEYHDKIFVIFQRLHGKGDYPGTGIGLAICKKIVERHKGRIWVKSKEGKGTSFFFSLRLK